MANIIDLLYSWITILDSPDFIGTDANIVRNEMIELYAKIKPTTMIK